MTGPVTVGLVGADGRMGQALKAAIESDPGFALGATLARGDRIEPFLAACAVVIDFSSPARLSEVAAACGVAGRPLVSGTTGLDEAAHQALAQAATGAPMVYAPNMSVGVNLLMHLVEKISETIDASWHTTIHETHHIHKKDAPSGTALGLGALIERHRGADSVDYKVVREGEAIGHHRVVFDQGGERLVLEHEALDRGIFALGALRAARWVLDQPPGLYGMDGVLGLE
jgi:4-hydroxy-tetrahydrodipicolinate reductase